MDKLFVRKDVYEEMLEKGFGKRDLSKLTKKQITDKNGHRRSVYVKNGEQPETQKQPKGKELLAERKRALYEDMLEEVKAGPDENALFVSGKGMLNKKDAIAHLEGKLGKTSGNVGQRMAGAEDKAFAESEKDAQKKYGNMSIEELKAEAKKYDGVSKYSPEANEARKVYDVLNQKLEEEKKSNNKENTKIENHADLLKQAEKIYVQAESDVMDSSLSREDRLKARDKEQDSYKLRELLEFGVDENGVAKNEKTATKIKELIQSLGLKDKTSQEDKKSESSEKKKEVDRLMKNGFDRRGAYAKVALDDITERLDTEKDKGIREKLFEDMRDVQQNGLNAKYFETHKEDYGF